MIYIGTQKQKKIITDIIEEIETDLAYEDNDIAIGVLAEQRDKLVNVINRGIGIICLR